MLSIESQTRELQRYRDKEGLGPAELLQEARSAKTTGRLVFNDMLKRIERGEANGIIAWHPDRLARNALDGGRIIHLLDTGKLTDLRFPTYSFENTPQGKFMLAIMFGQSKYYVDSLIENVRRGNRTKRENGWLPNLAPVGYLNSRSETGAKIIASDPNRFPILKRVWELLLTGGYSVSQLLDIATNSLGLRTVKRRRTGGGRLTASGLFRILSNPFYAGYIVHEDRWYPGKHEPMITLDQLEQAAILLSKRSRPRSQKLEFAYTGLIRCGNCGLTVTAERKVNRQGHHYLYYHCTRKRKDVTCKERSIDVRELERQIFRFVDDISLDGETLTKALQLIEEERKKETAAGNAVKSSLEQTLHNCDRSLDNLTRLRYRDLITDEEFVRQRTELSREQELLKSRLEQVKSEQWIEPSRKLFLFSNRAKFWLVHGSDTEKRQIVSTVGSNLLLKGKILSIDAKKPFRILRENRSFSDLCSTVNDVRTHFTSQTPPDSIPLLPPPLKIPKSA